MRHKYLILLILLALMGCQDKILDKEPDSIINYRNYKVGKATTNPITGQTEHEVVGFECPYCGHKGPILERGETRYCSQCNIKMLRGGAFYSSPFLIKCYLNGNPPKENQ